MPAAANFVDMRIKDLFFDRDAVARQASRTERKALSKAGAFIRRAARSSIRRRKRVSRPGEPPSAHRGDIKMIFFAYDPAQSSVVVGPLLLNQSKRQKTPTPQILEEGGSVTITDNQGRRVRARYEARPYMLPAFNTVLPDVPQMWADAGL